MIERINEINNSAPVSPDNLSQQRMQNVAKVLVDALHANEPRTDRKKRAVVWADPTTLQIAQATADRCRQVGADTSVFIRDLKEDAKAVGDLPLVTENGEPSVSSFFDSQIQVINDADAVFIFESTEQPNTMKENGIPEDKIDMYKTQFSRVQRTATQAGKEWSYIPLPTAAEAAEDGISHEELINYFFSAFEVEPEKIVEAQQDLIDNFLNPADKIILKNDNEDPKKSTDLEIDIRGMTFANSGVGRNIGFEVFTGPKDTNGQIFFKGKHKYKDYPIVEDILLIISNNKIVGFEASTNADVLKEILNIDEGANWVGEIGLGTNPRVVRPTINRMLVEKAGEHIALGYSYDDPEYNGVPVNLNNGLTRQQTKVHWDLTQRADTVIIEKDGVQQTLKEKGRFIERFDVFNPPLEVAA